MNKKILSLFCSGLMLFANAPCCAALGTSDAQINDYQDVNSSKGLSLEISFKENNVPSPLDDGVHAAIDQIELKLVRQLQPDGKFTTSSSYTIDLTSDKLSIPISLSYIDDSQSNPDITIALRLSEPADPDILKSEKTRTKALECLKKLKGLKFEISDSANNKQYLNTEITAVNNGILTMRDSAPDEITLSSMTNGDVGTDGSGPETQKLDLTISSTSGSLLESLLALADLELDGFYRLQIKGERK